MTKTCTKCGVEKDVSEFRQYRSKCKSCEREYLQEWRNKNKEHLRRSHNNWRNKNKERARKTSNKWYDVNKERVKEYYNNHKTERKLYTKQYRKEHPEKVKQAYKDWCTRNPEKVREYCRARRAKRYGVNERYLKEDRQYTLSLFNHQCACCGSTENLCIDHHYPLYKGPSPSPRSNAVVLCTSCNSSKRESLPEEFYTPAKLLWIESKLAQEGTHSHSQKS